MNTIKCALPKGKSTPIVQLFRRAGIPLPNDVDESRKYILYFENIEFILVKPIDIPVFVEFGAADIGLVGKEMILERNKDVIELLDLQTNPSKLMLLSLQQRISTTPTIATHFPNITS